MCVLFSRDPEEEFDSIYKKGEPAPDPTCYLAATARTEIRVWKDPNCGCCREWIVHLERNGFAVVAHDTGNVSARRRLGMPSRYGSCHTARIGNYVVTDRLDSGGMGQVFRAVHEGIGSPRRPRRDTPVNGCSTGTDSLDSA